MRIIAGSLGGRNFDSTAKATHPMSEKMRGAIFSALGDIEGLTILDVCSGSGAISFEAISRGAKSAIAIESNKKAQGDIALNIKKLGLAKSVSLVSANFYSWQQYNYDKFNIVVVDPPYNYTQIYQITFLETKLEPDGILILSLPPDSELPDFKNLEKLSEKKYGDSKLVFFKNTL
jgi:16S rRNA (guanine(966)-N(2))-methyltransferase RsmD